MSEKTASQIKYEENVKLLAKERFWRCPELAPEIIARHYCSLAVVALQLATAIRHRDVSDNPTAHQQIIDMLTKTICEAHTSDFGSELIPRPPTSP